MFPIFPLESMTFQSTPPAWEATIESGKYWTCLGVSIHAPRVGGDLDHIVVPDIFYVSIHAPRVGGDFPSHLVMGHFGVSIHAPRVGGD